MRLKISPNKKYLSGELIWVLLKKSNWLEQEKIKETSKKNNTKNDVGGREPWSSGYGRRLMFRRSWV